MKGSARWLAVVALALALLAPARTRAQQRPPGTEHEGAAFTFNQIAEGIYHIVPTGSMSAGANSIAVINDADVLLVDDHASPAAATVLIEELKRITPKPVKYVVDTHYHFDHAHGNQVFLEDVTIIGSEFTRQALAAGLSTSGVTWTRFVAPTADQAKAMRAQLDTTRAPADRAALERRIRIAEAYAAATAAVVPTPPNVSFDRRMTLVHGGREFQILFLGRGHTGGDVVVYLPRERILMGGDLVSTQPSFLGDAYAPDWIETLDALKRLDYDVILPGHGPPFRDTKARIDAWQSYLQDFWTQVSEQKKAGASVDDAARKIDLRAHAEDYPQIRAAGADRDAVARAYDILDGKVK